MSDNLRTHSISAAPEDVRRRSPTASRRRGGGGGGRPSGGGRMVGLSVLMAVLALGLAVASWFIANQQRLLTEEQRRVADANTRIEALEERLKMTDQVISETDAETGEQIDFWESEIRKLWAVSNDRNKKWIEDNQKLLQSLRTSVQALEATDKSMSSTLARHGKSLDRQQDVADQLAAVELQLQRIVRGQRDLVDKANTATQTVASMSSSVKEHEQAIAAIDSSRRQFNTRLLDIEQRLDALGAAGSGADAVSDGL